MNITPQLRASTPSSYTREQALIDLTTSENDPKDAVADFKVITQTLKPTDDLQDSTQAFRDLLKTFGNGSTSAVQSWYGQIASQREDGEAMGAATATFLQLQSCESDGQDAAADFAQIDARLRASESRADATGQFLRLLKHEGRGSTSAVQAHYSQIDKSLRADEPRSSGVDAFLGQLKAENDPQDAVKNYQLVQDTLKAGESRASATEQFLRILSVETSGGTTNAQADWKTVDSKVDDQHPRGEMVDSFLRLRTSARDAAAAREMFLLAH